MEVRCEWSAMPFDFLDYISFEPISWTQEIRDNFEVRRSKLDG